MKKIILSLAAIFIMGSMYSQSRIEKSTLRGGETTVNIEKNYQVDSSNIYWFISIDDPWYTAQTVVVVMDTTSPGDTTNVMFQGRLGDFDSWGTIGDTVQWDVTTADTVIKFTNTTESSNKEFRVLFIPDSTGINRITRLYFSLFYGLP